MISVANYFFYAECQCAECRYAECRYVECHYAECCYAECHCTECRGVANTIGTGQKTIQCRYAESYGDVKCDFFT